MAIYIYIYPNISNWYQRLPPFQEDRVKPMARRFGKLQTSPKSSKSVPKDAQKLNRSAVYFASCLVSLSRLQQGVFLFLRAASSLGLIHQDLSLRLKRKNRLATPKAPMATALSPSIRWSPMVPWEPLDRALLAGLKTGAAALNCRLPRREPGLHSGVGRRSKLDEVPISLLNAYLNHGAGAP